MKRFCKFLPVILPMALSISSITPVFAQDRIVEIQIGNKMAQIDGSTSVLDVEPYISNGNTMIPVRFVANALDISDDNILYDAITKTVTIIDENQEISLQINSNLVTVKTNVNGVITTNTKNMANDAKAEIVNSRTFVPFRELSVLFGLEIDWDGNEKKVTLISKNHNSDNNTNNNTNNNSNNNVEIATQATTSQITTQATTSQTTTNQSMSIREYEEEVVRLVNIERAKVGASPLEIYEPAMDLARAKSEDMATRNYFSHDDPQGVYMYREIGDGENIAVNQKTPAQVVNSWMNSEGHKANILNTTYKGIGVGLSEGTSTSDWSLYWTQIFVRNINNTVSTTQATTAKVTTEATTQTTTQATTQATTQTTTQATTQATTAKVTTEATTQATTQATTTQNSNTTVKNASTFEQEFVDYVNQERAKLGLEPLKIFDTAMDLARNQAGGKTINMSDSLKSYSNNVYNRIIPSQRTVEGVFNYCPLCKSYLTSNKYEYIGVGFDNYNWSVVLMDSTSLTTQTTTAKVTTETTTETTTQTTTQATTQATTVNARAYEEEVVRLVNIERANEGLDPLEIYEPAMTLARAKSQDMVDRNYFSHEDPITGDYMYSDLMKVSYTAAENIASGQKTPEAVVNSWMNSSGHRANILNSNFKNIGVGFSNYKWTQMFTGTIK